MRMMSVAMATASFLAIATAAEAQTGATGNAAAPASQQTSPTAATPTSAQGATAETPAAMPDIIVTAQKRSERLQDVPIAVSAFSGETLKEQRIESGNQLNQY
ncbi:MAG: TonB-dependent receptor, partial [Alphaproteobacteria bacterium]